MQEDASADVVHHHELCHCAAAQLRNPLSLRQVDAAACALSDALAPRPAIRTLPLGCDRDGAAYWRLHSAPLLTGEGPPEDALLKRRHCHV
jgi:hypothetical protein